MDNRGKNRNCEEDEMGNCPSCGQWTDYIAEEIWDKGSKRIKELEAKNKQLKAMFEATKGDLEFVLNAISENLSQNFINSEDVLKGREKIDNLVIELNAENNILKEKIDNLENNIEDLMENLNSYDDYD